MHDCTSKRLQTFTPSRSGERLARDPEDAAPFEPLDDWSCAFVRKAAAKLSVLTPRSGSNRGLSPMIAFVPLALELHSAEPPIAVGPGPPLLGDVKVRRSPGNSCS
mmetsp:Transcript_75096/g.244144  ORF Transcript_75096/g.244144 Transcript_75096/m.244144 type:complete len:106 (+) Transcript_75096:458-775(+)